MNPPPELSTLIDPENERGKQLYEAYQHRYFEFIDQLPLTLRRAAQEDRTFLGAPTKKKFTGFAGVNPIYTGIPWLFWELFCELDDARFLDLAAAGGYFALASILLDHLIDQQVQQPTTTLLLARAFDHEGGRLLRKEFSSTAQFWDDFDRLFAEFLSALSLEQDIQLDPRKLAIENHLAMAQGKMCPMVIAVAALSSLTAQKDLLGRVELSLKYTFAAGQFHDDALDLEMDVSNEHATFLISQLTPPAVLEAQRRPTWEEVLAENEAAWLDVTHLESALTWYGKAVDVLGGLRCASWRAYLAQYTATARQHRKHFLSQHIVNKMKKISV